MNLSKRTHMYNRTFLAEKIKFKNGEFLDYKVEEHLLPNRGSADTYLLSKEGAYFVLTLYKRGLYAPRENLTKILDLSREDTKNIASIVNCGYSEEYFRDYTISEVKKNTSIKYKKLKNFKGMIQQVVEAMEVSHSNSVYHYDLRPEDIFIADKQPSTYKVYGFGHVCIDEEDYSKDYLKIKGLISKYQAPEVEKCKSCEKSDLWSLGVILHEQIYGNLPFEYQKNEFGKYKINFSNLKIVEENSEYIELLKGLLNLEPQERWGIKEVKNWLLYVGNEEQFEDSKKNKKRFLYKNKDYASLDELNNYYAYSPEGYRELEKIYYKGDILSWLLDKKKIDELKILNNNLSSKYLFNRYLYSYGSENEKLYFKGYDLNSFKNLDKFTLLDLKKISKFLKGTSAKANLIFEKIKNKISKERFYYAYVNNKEMYLRGKKASTFSELPSYGLEEEDVESFLLFRGEKNYKKVYSFLYRILLKRENAMERLKNSIMRDEFQLLLFNSSLIDEAKSYSEFKKYSLKKSKDINLDVFQKIYFDYNFLNVPFENALLGRRNIKFYDFYVKEKYGKFYFSYYKKIISLFSEESVFNFFEFKNLREVYKFCPELAKIELKERVYIKFQVELLERIYEEKLYEKEEIDCKIKKIKLKDIIKKQINF